MHFMYTIINDDYFALGQGERGQTKALILLYSQLLMRKLKMLDMLSGLERCPKAYASASNKY